MKKKTMTTRKSKFKLPSSEVERIKQIVPTIAELRNIDLKRDYCSVRNNYYGNKIPPADEVLIAFMPRSEIRRLSGYDDDETDGLCSFGIFRGVPAPKAILLPDDLKVNETRTSLLHETAHMKVNLQFGRNMGHGKYWEKEMRRLMLIGAFDGWL
jgi:hypothetical protein